MKRSIFFNKENIMALIGLAGLAVCSVFALILPYYHVEYFFKAETLTIIQAAAQYPYIYATVIALIAGLGLNILSYFLWIIFGEKGITSYLSTAFGIGGSIFYLIGALLVVTRLILFPYEFAYGAVEEMGAAYYFYLGSGVLGLIYGCFMAALSAERRGGGDEQ